MTAFRDAIKADLGSPKVAALAAGARLSTSKRLAASAAFPTMDHRRDEARRIRLSALFHLDSLLAQFADNVAAHGGKVYFADDAQDAIGYITRVAHSVEAKRVVKAKSMVTEEISLNEALEHEGIEVVETDLGEFIIQLAEDRPSHIIAPVLHKTRQEVGRLFEEKLGVAYSDDPAQLNRIAREYLRSRFLSADLGVSGVNLAIAETGSIVLVTNEGNGRLSTSAPAVHIAVMGMERIVETPSQASVVLDVLARSGTGQPLTVYTNVITGPRRSVEPDGPDELHIVILDNGRSKVLAGPVAEILTCIRCGACLNVCPVFRQIGGHAYGSVYPGPIGSVLSPALWSNYGELPFASTLCGACREACPVRIDLPGLLVEMRTAADKEVPAYLRRAVGAYTAAATHPKLWNATLRTGGLLGSIKSSDGWIEKLPWHGKAWTDSRHLPAPARRPFRSRWKDRNGA